jgi:hypothetical protein
MTDAAIKRQLVLQLERALARCQTELLELRRRVSAFDDQTIANANAYDELLARCHELETQVELCGLKP